MNEELRKKSLGFTLIEVLVVMGITMLLTTMAIVYNRGSESRFAVASDQSAIAVSINRAKSLTLGRSGTPDIPSGMEVCAFGIHFDGNNNRFTIYQDLEPENNCSKPNNQYTFDGTQLETIRSVDLDPRVEFNFSGTRDVAFKPPFLEAVSSSSFPVRVDLISTDGITEQSLIIESSGRVVFDQ